MNERLDWKDRVTQGVLTNLGCIRNPVSKKIFVNQINAEKDPDKFAIGLNE